MPPIEEKSPTRQLDEEPTLEGAFSDDGVDLTVIRWMLKLTPAQRLEAAQDLIDAANALRSTDEDTRATGGTRPRWRRSRSERSARFAVLT